jgi:predicted ribosomally synthesized peptide with SipW-like signal peptide
MLVGSTFAWFTDSVTSGRNIIQSGNLDVVLEYWDGNSYEEVTSTTKLFNDAALWEPGYTEVAYLKVSNAGSLALKYHLAVSVFNETLGKTKTGADIKLSDYLQFKVVESDTDLVGTYGSREAAQAAPATATKLQTYSSDVKALVNTGDTDYVALVIYMPTTVGNEANHDGVNVPKIEMGVNLFATQVEAEKDSFDEYYDKDATLPSQSYAVVDGNDTEISVGDATVVVPKEAEDGAYTLRIENENKATNANDETVVSFDLSLEKDGVPVATQNGVVYDVAGLFLDVIFRQRILGDAHPQTGVELDLSTAEVEVFGQTVARTGIDGGGIGASRGGIGSRRCIAAAACEKQGAE